MKILAAIALAMIGVLGGCATHTAPAVREVEMAPLAVGTRTPDYEVTSPTALTLAPGVKLQALEDANGNRSGFLLMRNNGVGGYMACGCVGATTSSCKTENDNPDHASCSGSCTDSEGNGHPCEISGPIIGPPKDPYILKFISKAEGRAPDATPVPAETGR